MTGLSADGARSLADRLTGLWRFDRGPDAPAVGADVPIAARPAVHRMAGRHAARNLADLLQPDETIVLVRAQPDFRETTGRLSVELVALTDRRAVASAARVDAATTPWRVTREFDESPLDRVVVEHRPGLDTYELRLGWRPGAGFEVVSRDAPSVERVRAFVATPTAEPFPEVAGLLARPPLDPDAPPPDWYPDPDGGPGSRYWDGVRWIATADRR